MPEEWMDKAAGSYPETDDIVKDIRCIIETSQSSAYRAVNRILVQRNWLIGHRIAVEDLKGNNRAEYGAEIIVELSKILTAEYGKGFTKTNLYHFYSFYKTYPEIFHTVCGKSKELLSWSHYRVLLQVNDKTARDWYEQEAREQTWSVRTLQRNVSSQYYYRMLKSQNKPAVENEMKRLTADYQADKLEFIKNPVVAEFLGMASNTDFTESDLEKSILSNLQKFLMELGKGICLCSAAASSCLPRSISFTCRPKKNFGRKSKRKRRSSICSRQGRMRRRIHEPTGGADKRILPGWDGIPEN